MATRQRPPSTTTHTYSQCKLLEEIPDRTGNLQDPSTPLKSLFLPPPTLFGATKLSQNKNFQSFKLDSRRGLRTHL